jgi:RNA polymerase sigma-70 factor (ECF subfamily)
VTQVLLVSMLDSAHVPTSECRRILPRSNPLLDEVLVKAQTGDSDAFTELYWRHQKRVFSICMRMVHNFSLAEDLMQETFVQLHRKLATFRGDSAFTIWLHRMTVNIVLMHLRKRVLPVVSIDRLATSDDEEHAGQGFGICDPRLVGVVDRLTITRAVATLAPGYRNMFLLHDVHGFEHREIASMQGCTLGNSKSQLHKARRALRGALSSNSRDGAQPELRR